MSDERSTPTRRAARGPAEGLEWRPLTARSDAKDRFTVMHRWVAGCYDVARGERDRDAGRRATAACGLVWLLVVRPLQGKIHRRGSPRAIRPAVDGKRCMPGVRDLCANGLAARYHAPVPRVGGQRADEARGLGPGRPRHLSAFLTASVGLHLEKPTAASHLFRPASVVPVDDVPVLKQAKVEYAELG